MTKTASSSKKPKTRALAELPSQTRLIVYLVSFFKAASLVGVAWGVSFGLVAVLGGNASDIGVPLIVLASSGLLRAVTTYTENVLYPSLAYAKKHAARSRVMSRITKTDSPSVGSTTSLLTHGLDERDKYYTAYLPAYVDSMVIPLLIVVSLYVVDWVSGIVVTLTLPLIPLFMILVGKYTKQQTAAALSSLTRFSSRLTELAKGLPVLMGLGRADEQADSVKHLSQQLQHKNTETLKTALLSALVLELIATISVAVVAVFVGVRLLYGEIPLSIGLMALLLAPECYNPFRQVGSAYHASNTGSAALESIKKILTMPLRKTSRRKNERVVFDNISIRYQNRSQPAVKNLSYNFGKKGVALLQGRSGSGKTTLLHLLSSSLPTTAIISGVIKAPKKLAYLSQQPTFSAHTVAQELELYGSKKLDHNIVSALRLDTLLDTDPELLSPGERRRVAFAGVYMRALQNPNCLVLLDEPTAHVDKNTADAIIQAIRRLAKKSLIIVASHDPAVQALANEQVTLGEPSKTRHVSAAAESINQRPTKQLSTNKPVLVAPTTSLRTSILALLSSSWRKYVNASLLGVLAAVFAITLTSLSGWLIVRASEQPPVLYLLVAIVGVRFFGIGRAVLYYWSRLAIHDAVFDSATWLRVRLWKGLASKGPAFRSLLSAGNTMDRIVRDSDRVQELLPRLLLPLVSFTVVSLGLSVAIVVLLPNVVLVTIGLQLFLFGLLAIMVLRTNYYSARQIELESQLTLQTVRLIENSSQARANGYLTKLQSNFKSTSLAISNLSNRLSVVVASVQSLSVVAIYLYVASLVYFSGVTGAELGPLLAVALLAPLGLLPLFDDSTTAIQQWPLFVRVVRRTDAITAVTAEASDGHEPINGQVKSLQLTDVSYRYPQAKSDTLTSITASAARSRWLFVTGPSGSGKSTLLALLLKNLSPTAGSYSINQQNISDISVTSVRSHIAWCPQEGHLFNSTLRGNLLLARTRDDAPSDSEMTQALQKVGLLPLLQQMKHGLDTNIGSDGQTLSGGQRQRVALARTLLAKSDAILLDEPTAHLDEETSQSIVDELSQILKNHLVVVVSHDKISLDSNNYHPLNI